MKIMNERLESKKLLSKNLVIQDDLLMEISNNDLTIVQYA